MDEDTVHDLYMDLYDVQNDLDIKESLVNFKNISPDYDTPYIHTVIDNMNELFYNDFRLSVDQNILLWTLWIEVLTWDFKKNDTQVKRITCFLKICIFNISRTANKNDI